MMNNIFISVLMCVVLISCNSSSCVKRGALGGYKLCVDNTKNYIGISYHDDKFLYKEMMVMGFIRIASDNELNVRPDARLKLFHENYPDSSIKVDIEGNEYKQIEKAWNYSTDIFKYILDSLTLEDLFVKDKRLESINKLKKYYEGEKTFTQFAIETLTKEDSQQLIHALMLDLIMGIETHYLNKFKDYTGYNSYRDITTTLKILTMLGKCKEARKIAQEYEENIKKRGSGVLPRKSDDQ